VGSGAVGTEDGIPVPYVLLGGVATLPLTWGLYYVYYKKCVRPKLDVLEE